MWGETIYWERGGRLYNTNIGYKQVYAVYVTITAIQQPPVIAGPNQFQKTLFLGALKCNDLEQEGVVHKKMIIDFFLLLGPQGWRVWHSGHCTGI